MGMTITEKILAAHAGREHIVAGELINIPVDLVLGNDVTTPIAIKEFERIGVKTVFDPEKIALVPDHFTPNKDIKSAEQVKLMREFAYRHGIKHYFEIGRTGIEHCLLPEAGLVLPGDVVIGADSHTCTYGALGAFATGVGSTDMAAAMATGEAWFRVPETIRFVYFGRLRPWVTGKDLILYTIGLIGVEGARYAAMEFVGEAIPNLSQDSRFTMANMAIEAGAKNGIFIPDAITEDYVAKRAQRSYLFCASDPEASYKSVVEIDVSKVELRVAFPHSPENSRRISEAVDIRLDQVVIGSCTNGRMEDLRLAAQILQGRKVAPSVRLIILPGTQTIYRKALEEGLLEVFLDAGAAISTPTCGPCLGGHMGVLAKGERALATTNRNFVGRMGHPESEVYLSGPAVAAASAVMGRIATPEMVVGKGCQG